MKKRIIIAFVIFLGIVSSLFAYVANSWHTYRQEYPPIAFEYPKSFGQPEIYSDKTKSQWEVSFRRADSGFQINNGFHHIWSEGATLEKHLTTYQADMDAKNEIKDYKIEYIRVGDFPAVKVRWHGFNYAVTDIFIYQDTMSTSNVIMIQAGEEFVDDKTLEKIVQSLRLTSNSFLQHPLSVVPDGMEQSLATSMAMTGELLTSTTTEPDYSDRPWTPQGKKDLKIYQQYTEIAAKLSNEELVNQLMHDGEKILVQYDHDLEFKVSAFESEAYRRKIVDSKIEILHGKILREYKACFGVPEGQCRE